MGGREIRRVHPQLMSPEHVHDYGTVTLEGDERRIVWCQAGDDCYETQVAELVKRGKAKGSVRLRDLSPNERVSFVAKMFEDLVIVDTMRIIHGPVHGERRAREVLGYPPAPWLGDSS